MTTVAAPAAPLAGVPLSGVPLPGVPGTPNPRRLLWLILPLVALALAAAWLLSGDRLDSFRNGAPPVEGLTFERTILDGDGIHLRLRAGGSEPMAIAQVLVDDAFWTFTQDPPGPLDRLATAWLHIPYPWVLGEAHVVKVLTSTGTPFEADIAVAVATPTAAANQLVPMAVLGIFVGVVPITIGLLFYPALRGMSGRGLAFVLALTIGLLVFLLIDTLEAALELAAAASPAFQGPALVLLVAAAATLLLFAVGRRGGAPSGIALATYIAIGIGLHNFGEGMAIGAAFAAGAAGLGTFLVLGFTLHNVTEGIGIAAPMVGARPRLVTFVGLALLAGAPAIVGIWLGSFTYAPQWAAIALAIGAGAILQVIVEVGGYLARRNRADGRPWLDLVTLAGLILGVGVMYATALLVSV